jgi:hypothetical protein
VTPRLWLLVAGLTAVGTAGTVAVRSGDPAPSTATGAAPASAAPRSPSTSTVTDVKLDVLQQPQDALSPPRRDPFHFRPVAPPPNVIRVAPPMAPPVATFTGPPPPPPIPLRYIGVIETPQQPGRVALLSDGRGGLMHGREGDIIEGRFRVLRVGVDSIELAYADGRGRQTIRLSGQ